MGKKLRDHSVQGAQAASSGDRGEAEGVEEEGDQGHSLVSSWHLPRRHCACSDGSMSQGTLTALPVRAETIQVTESLTCSPAGEWFNEGGMVRLRGSVHFKGKSGSFLRNVTIQSKVEKM